MPEFLVREPRSGRGRIWLRLFQASILLPILAMAAIVAYYSALPPVANSLERQLRDTDGALLFFVCILFGLVTVPITGLAAWLTRGRTRVVELPAPPA